jgi:cytochrome c peroxidase
MTIRMDPRLRPGRLGIYSIFLILPAAGCQPAVQYGPGQVVQAVRPSEETPPAKSKVPGIYAWLPPAGRMDIPIKFMPPAAKEWHGLAAYWSITPHPVAGQATVHLAQSGLGAPAALLLAGQVDLTISIKVPLGLPAPTYPRANPPTYLKWDLGRRLFFDRSWLTRDDHLACATCHNPEEGFTEHRPTPVQGDLNALSLINCVYNRHQFWDGRVTELEQVIQRDLADEGPLPSLLPLEQRPAYRHAWNGIVHRLEKSDSYRHRFQKVFGTRPTQDNVAKALATYLRTILSGNSIYDRAKQEAVQRGDTELKAAHFEVILDAAAVKALGGALGTPGDAAAALARGHQLFHGRAGCAQCHPGPLFTDHDFHNVGVRESSSLVNLRSGDETGRFVQVPIGLKEKRLIGAFRTPTLRALPRTAPYFHDGSSGLLDGVVAYFNKGLEAQAFLDPLFLNPDGSLRRLNLDGNEIRDVAVFLRALDGEPVPPIVAGPPKD